MNNVDRLKWIFVDAIIDAMEQQNISRAGLARRLKVSRAYITKILKYRNFSNINTMIKLTEAVGLKFTISLEILKG